MDSIKITLEIPESVSQEFMDKLSKAFAGQMSHINPDELLTAKETMHLLKVKRTTFQLYKQMGLPHKKIGGKTTYQRSEILEWHSNYSSR